MFGSEVGKYLYRAVQEDMKAEFRDSRMGLITYCMSNPFFSWETGSSLVTAMS